LFRIKTHSSKSRVGVDAGATSTSAINNVCQASITLRIDPWVEEAQWWLAGMDTCRVEQAHNTCEGWCRSTGPGDERVVAFIEDMEVVRLGSNIWESTAGLVELAIPT